MWGGVGELETCSHFYSYPLPSFRRMELFTLHQLPNLKVPREQASFPLPHPVQ